MPDWLKKAVFYDVYPQSFYDSNGDGIGDINGIAQKLDYICDLGCNAIWLNPCFDSPFMDGGYDVRDYKKVAPRYGTNEDLVRLMDKVHQKGMHILLDLVPGHTSDQNEWFLKSKEPESNEYSSRYIWTDSVWEAPSAYRLMCGITDRDGNYLVNYFSSQPALNYGFAQITHPQWQLPCDHPECLKTVEAIKDVMRFWLEKGCDGFRVDMADSLVKNEDDKKQTAKIWRGIRQMLDKEYPQAVLVSEWSHPQRAINNAGFHADFYLDHKGNGYHSLFRSTDAQGNNDSFFCKDAAGDITRFTREYEKNLLETKDQGYISFITGNHDTPRLRRTLDKRAAELACCTIFTLPGVPFLYYGDEIGMRYIEGLQSKEGGFSRTGSRTPMQWSRGKNLGFSQADEKEIYLPVDSSEDAPTVEDQMCDEQSMLHTVRQVLKLRNEYEQLQADGPYETIYAEKNKYPFIYKRGSFIFAVNPSGKEQRAPFAFDGQVVFSVGNCRFAQQSMIMEPQSFCAYKLKDEMERRK